MWSAIKSSILGLFGVPQSRSDLLRLAKAQGFLTDEEIERAERLLEEDHDRTNTDLLVDEGFLTGSQAEIIALAHKEEAPVEHMHEQVQRASKAVSDTGALHLSQVAAALAKKK